MAIDPTVINFFAAQVGMTGVVVQLLIDKGLLTREEAIRYMTDYAERVDGHEQTAALAQLLKNLAHVIEHGTSLGADWLVRVPPSGQA
jgi:hypothetical protein